MSYSNQLRSNLKHRSFKSKNLQSTDISYPKFILYGENHCQNPKNKYKSFIFLKVHKCGSSLLKKIFNRYVSGVSNISRRHTFIGPFLGGYPGKFLAKFAGAATPRSMTNHQRWNQDLREYDKAFNQTEKTRDYYKIALIRQPLGQYVSAYNFFFAMKGVRHQNDSSACWLEGYNQVFQSMKDQPASKKLPDFLAKLEPDTVQKFRDAFWGFRGLNFMSFDFGLNWKYKMSIAEIEETVNQFDVVIVLERLAESLILLKHMMCMDYQDLVLDVGCGRCSNSAAIDLEITKPIEYERLNLTKYGIDDQHSQIIEDKFIFNDIELYNAVGRKFKRDMEKFGLERMKSELKILEKYQKEHEAKMKKHKVKKRSIEDYLEMENQEYLRNVEKLQPILDSGMNSRQRRSWTNTSEPIYQELVSYMIENGQGYCGYYQKEYGFSERTDFEIDGRQPWWSDYFSEDQGQ